MTGFVLVDQGKAAVLDGTWNPGTVNSHARLYSGDPTTGLTPDEIDALTEADFTEATFAGYSAAALTGGSWAVTGAATVQAAYAAQTFTRSSTGTPEDIHGWYLTRASDGALIGFQSAGTAAPITIETAGDAITVTPTIAVANLETGGDTDMPTGAVIPWTTTTAPEGYLLCNGAAVSRTTYAPLFGVIGTTYGSGDGSTTFNVPDIRQRVVLGQAASGTGSTIGATGGAIDHTHPLSGTGAAAVMEINSSNGDIYARVVAATASTFNRFTDAGTYASISTASSTGTALVGSTDTSNPPYIALPYIIKT